MSVIGTAANFSTIACFVVEAFGLGHILSSTAKDPDAIMEEARGELCAAFNILEKFELVVDDDLLSPLVEKYERLHERLMRVENDITAAEPEQSKSFKKSLKNCIFSLEKREAKKTLILCHKLFVQIRSASEDGRLAKFKKKRNWISEPNVIPPAVPQSEPASRISVPPPVIKHDLRKSNILHLYPPARAGSLASILSDPFKDPPGAFPSDPLASIEDMTFGQAQCGQWRMRLSAGDD